MTENPRVGGSIPALATILFSQLRELIALVVAIHYQNQSVIDRYLMDRRDELSS